MQWMVDVNMLERTIKGNKEGITVFRHSSIASYAAEAAFLESMIISKIIKPIINGVGRF